MAQEDPSPSATNVVHLRTSAMFVCLLHFFQFIIISLFSGCNSNYCDLDTGYTTILDGRGYPHSVYISVIHDGSVWMRAGADTQNTDWTLTKVTLLSGKDTVNHSIL